VTQLPYPNAGLNYTLRIYGNDLDPTLKSEVACYGTVCTSRASSNTGPMDITATVPNWLQFNWKGTGNTNPTARATFGIYKGNNKFIYIRELY
jgi:MSHA biogenesis protein MshQ